MWRIGATAVLGLAFFGCSDGPECRTQQDCIDLGKTQLECIGGACVEACSSDADCRIDKGRDSRAVCERGLCQEGCPAAACAAGEMCEDGRCLLYFESFEGAQSGDFVTLESRSWNDIDRPLRNKSTQVVWSGLLTCTAADRPERCAGPAAAGDYFVALERAPTPANPTFEFGPSCGACTCCRACRDPSAREPGVTECFGTTLPNLGGNAMCVAPPTACDAICQACDQCPAAPPGTVGSGLDMCALQAAEKTCPGCAPYDQCVATKLAETRACPGGNYPACAVAPTTMAECQDCVRQECDGLRSACWACRDFAQLKQDFPGDPSRWQEQEMACQMQGPNGCYNTPINTPRSVLSDAEQAIESPAIPLANQTGNVVLQFQYVPFNIGSNYRRVIQGQDPRTWPLERQEVRVQLCGAGCSEDAAWRDATLLSGEPAVFPRDDERGNGLQFASQSRADWTIDVVQVAIPAELRTAEFRFRLVPRLQDAARIGVDRVLIRRLP